jgi:hypothetical protein
MNAPKETVDSLRKLQQQMGLAMVNLKKAESDYNVALMQARIECDVVATAQLQADGTWVDPAEEAAKLRAQAGK